MPAKPVLFSLTPRLLGVGAACLLALLVLVFLLGLEIGRLAADPPAAAQPLHTRPPAPALLSTPLPQPPAPRPPPPPQRPPDAPIG